MALPSIPLPCGKNLALDGINDVSKSIKAALASKKGALGGLTSLAASAKSKLAAFKAKIPSLDSFQAELAGLAAAGPAALAAFKAKWKGKVPNLDSYVSKLTSLNFCKDVPNVKMDPVTKETKTEAKVSPTPNITPPAPVPVPKTVVDNTAKPSTGKTPEVQSTLLSEYMEKVSKPYNLQVTQELAKKSAAIAAEANALRNSSDGKKLGQKKKSTGWDTEVLVNNGKLSPAELAAAQGDEKLKKKAGLHNATCSLLDSYWNALKKSKEPSSKIDIKEVQKAVDENKDIDEIGYRNFFTTTKGIADSNSDILVRWNNYCNNKT